MKGLYIPLLYVLFFSSCSKYCQIMLLSIKWIYDSFHYINFQWLKVLITLENISQPFTFIFWRISYAQPGLFVFLMFRIFSSLFQILICQMNSYQRISLECFQFHEGRCGMLRRDNRVQIKIRAERQSPGSKMWLHAENLQKSNPGKFPLWKN